MDNHSYTFSQRANRLNSSVIREILKLTERPDMISFAGGLPAPYTFPVEALQSACASLFQDHAHASLQYGPTEGQMELREWIAQRHGTTASRVLMTTGSQQGLDLLGKVFIDPGSKILVETPTYLGALQAFTLYEPSYSSIPSDDFGLLPQELTPELADGARFIYTIPNFQNPTGRRIPLNRRHELVAQAKELGILLVEDDPYGELSYSGDHLPSLHSLNPDDVIYLGSFSKILAPGLRLGYIIAPEAIHLKLVQAKQATDLHTPSFTQRIAYEALRSGLLDSHLPIIRQRYSAQCQAMLEALARHMPDGIHWSRPEGGMFIWLELPEDMDAEDLLQKAVAHSVAFVPGAPFYASSPHRNTMRLAFVTVPPERIEQGISVLGQLIRDQLSIGYKTGSF
ncbi:aminotransferase-like domain-containing protein [Vogesella indigofera]|uniref:aminotransferase-like domain-containing protein n=1 Tax=Vogesella indigofera TaxID=45465 RepID=UPI00234F5485|nr:PLP-dependent aminotransferase family protein [Vogesella indigofera]MDC7701705.1 PLP-dependent aminotransferase family protein [Vogesella indigofera]